MSYVDGFVLPVRRAQLDDYFEMARNAGELWREHGALQYVECVADDVQAGERTSFPQSVQLREDEVVVFAYIVYRSREERDRINAAVMADPRMQHPSAETVPFDPARMFWGGFRAQVEL